MNVDTPLNKESETSLLIGYLLLAVVVITI